MTVTEYTGLIRSNHLGNQRPVWIRPPLRGTSRNLLMFLDAELYRERVRAADVVDALRLDHTIADAWVVFVSTHSVEARWVECPCHPPFARFIAEELMGWLGAALPDTAGVAFRTLVGLSYTGLAAAYIAREVQGLFHRVVSQSGSFWWNDCWLAQAYANGPVPNGTEFYLEVGRREVQENVRHREDVLQVVSQIEGVGRFRDVLLRRGVPVQYSEYDGGHDCRDWRITLPRALQWALPPATGSARGGH